MSLEQYYRTFALYRQTKGTSAVDEPTFTLVGHYRGFIQPVGGGQSGQFNADHETYTHRLYTPVATPILDGDQIRQDGVKWRAVFPTQPTGISAVDHHKEVTLSHA